jgi:hypothetical protein
MAISTDATVNGWRLGMKLSWETPKITDFGSIADHTFDNPGAGDKSATVQATDKFGEFSHPSP